MSRSIIILMSGPKGARILYNKLGVSRDLQSRSFCIVPGFLLEVGGGRGHVPGIWRAVF